MSDTPETILVHPVGSRVAKGSKKPHVGPDRDAYHSAHLQTLGEHSDHWWAKTARETLHWDRDFHTVRSGGFEDGNIAWFVEGQLNASYNCVDRWAFKHPNKTAIIYEADEPNEHQYISYKQLHIEVCRVANVLKQLGVKKGDTVSIYLPMTWYSIAAFLACARIGAIHSVVFAGFSSESLRDRIVDCKSKVLITSDEGRRGGKSIATKAIVDVALASPECKGIVEKVLVLQRTGGQVNMVAGRDLWWHEETEKVPGYCPCEAMNAEDPLFILYTSGSTGKPKGVVHTTGGYLLCAALTVKYVFDVHPDDNFACMADIGWITGHTYIVYGPLANGVSTTVFESTPVYPTPSRYWETVAKHKITQFYSAPTAIRLLRRLGHQHVEPHDLSTLRILGSVGEPINPEAWTWYHEHVGRKECSIVDTFWQTETGSIVITPFPGAISTKPGSATVPFFGIHPELLEPTSGKELEGETEGVLVLKKPWPSIARTIWGDHKRYLDVYMKPYPGYFYTGDGAARDADGYIWIKGRVDDVINVSGHRLSTAEIESALILHKGVAETAVIGTNDELTGQAVYAFVTMKPEFTYDAADEASLIKELVIQVRKTIGPFAAPKKVYIVSDLPKTRSGKIMRRIMRKIVAGEGDQLGDLSTVAEPGVVDVIKKKVAETN
ncbi:acetyl-CoA synthetase [Marasmius oreades]|uniref:Acetyl-coenzyme A synthetase n=1 Tax=Marasmius oreades TaxID=181124 RepID=A0A9P7UWU2_9AGAR|nr:acetyl-CoA synthetase [Marasmius oreades]KAG7096115.1 acetyl-CoA synthetase [Marasmius oreades]